METPPHSSYSPPPWKRPWNRLAQGVGGAALIWGLVMLALTHYRSGVTLIVGGAVIVILASRGLRRL